MLIKVLGKLPQQSLLALSGGADSVACYHFLTKDGKRDITPVYFDHGTEHGAKALAFLKERYPGLVYNNKAENRAREKSESQEEYWRNIRYAFFKSVADESELPVITCHHLNDCVETWIFTSLHGEPRIIPYMNDFTLRPFLLTKKRDLITWCKKYNLEWIEDKSNSDTHYMRNFIRAEIMPKVLVVNPGIEKVIARKIIKYI